MAENQPESKREVRIHIDRKKYESPNPTTGEALYLLGKVPPGHELYREVQGDEEDKPIHNGNEQIHLKEDEHFYSEEHHKKEFTIIVNGRKKVVAKGTDVRRNRRPGVRSCADGSERPVHGHLQARPSRQPGRNAR